PCAALGRAPPFAGALRPPRELPARAGVGLADDLAAAAVCRRRRRRRRTRAGCPGGGLADRARLVGRLADRELAFAEHDLDLPFAALQAHLQRLGADEGLVAH